ncbi:MAG TPA: hypothetical protein VEJ87_12150 [Acidimicrobiales bacterium]|nr:hypothetical protein [Acidimicrobiales bacterium]
MIRAMAKLTVAASLMAGVVGGISSVAGATHVRVGPNQYFFGTVNGVTGDAVLKVVCPGPSTTGHAVAGQPLEVDLEAAAAGPFGFTGSAAHSIVANLAIAKSTTSGHLAVFEQYGVKRYFPTNVSLPCSGQGVVLFDPSPTSGSAVPFGVSITFENVGV